MSVNRQAVRVEPMVHAPTAREALTRNVGFDMLARAGYVVSRVFIPPFVLARVGLASYSLWSAVFIVVSYLGISSLGFSAAYVKCVAENVARGEERRANALLSTGLFLCLVVCGGLFGLLFLGLHTVLAWFNVPSSLRDQARDVILLVAGIHTCSIIFSVFEQTLAGCQKVAEVQAIWVVSYLVEAILIFVLVGTGHGVMGLAEAFVIRSIISIVLSIYLAYRMAPWLHISPRLCTRSALHELLSFGGVVQLVALLSTALNTVERVIAAPLIGLEAVGLMDLADKLPSTAAYIPTAFATSLVPTAAYLRSGLGETEHGRETITKLYLKSSRYMNFASSAVAGFLAMAAAPVLRVWIGKMFPGMIYLMTIFAVQQHMHLSTGPGTSILKGLGRPWEEYIYTVTNIVAVAIIIPLSRILFGGWSAVELGTAVVAATAISAFIFIARANYLFKVSWLRYLTYVIAPGILPYAIAGLLISPFWEAMVYGGRWRAAAILAAVGIFYSAVLLVAIDRLVLELDERAWFRGVVAQWSGYNPTGPGRGNVVRC